MNKENLLKAADLIEKIPADKFDMTHFREGDLCMHECDSVGCIVGHSTILDTRNNLLKYRRMGAENSIDFFYWSMDFFGFDVGISPLGNINGYGENSWDYLFESIWRKTDNTPMGAARRIRHFVENGLPDNWYDQMNGNAKLSYNE